MITNASSKFRLGVKVGGKELAFSGFVHLDTTEVDIEVNNVTYQFRFKSDDGAARYEAKVGEGSKLIIELFNHNNSLGEGVYTPLEIGTMANRKHYITYVVHTADKSKNLRTFEFAFYLGDAL